MIKRIATLGAALTFCMGTMCAQNGIKVSCDTLKIDDCNSVQPTVAQIPLTECQSVDTCENAQYAIVTKDNKQGIYDLRKQLNITPITYQSLSYYECEVTEWGTPVTYFLATRGTELGRISVNGTDNQTFEVWNDNPELVASLTYCTTLDEQLMKQCRMFLSNGLKTLNGTHGQLAVIDAQTGHLKAWVALRQNKEGNVVDAKLLKKTCGLSSSLPLFALAAMQESGLSLSDSIDVDNGIYRVSDTLTIRDHNWRWGGYGKMSIHDALTHHSKVAIYKLLKKGFDDNKATRIWQLSLSASSNAMELAVLINSFCSLTDLREPTLIGDSLTITPLSNDDKAIVTAYHTFMADMNKGNALQAKYAPHGVKLSGSYSFETRPTMNDREMSFGGAFPADKPRYAIGAFIDIPRNDAPHYSGELAKLVINPLIEWVMKR